MKIMVSIILSFLVFNVVAQEEKSDSYEHEYVHPFNDWDTAFEPTPIGAKKTEDGFTFYKLNSISYYIDDHVVDSTVSGSIRVDLKILTERDHSDEEVADEACRLAGYEFALGHEIRLDKTPEQHPNRSYFSVMLYDRVYPEKATRIFSHIKCTGKKLLAKPGEEFIGKIDFGENKVLIDSKSKLEIMFQGVKEIGHYGPLTEKRYADVVCQLEAGKDYEALKFYIDKRSGFGLPDGYVLESESGSYELVENYLSETFAMSYFSYIICEKK